MGKINILKAGYEGKLGTTYGVAKKGLYDIKATPFSHTPHNNRQSKAKDRFTRLNRICSRIVKKCWSYLGLSDKEMYRNNALCKEWKDALQTDEFLLENLKLVIDTENPLEITTIEFDPQNFTFSYSAEDVSGSGENSKQFIYLSIITNEFVTKFDNLEKGKNNFIQSKFDFIDFAFFQVYAFRCFEKNGKWKIGNLSITDKVFLIIVNEIIYLSRWRWNREPYVKDEILYLDSDNIHVENEIIYF